MERIEGQYEFQRVDEVIDGKIARTVVGHLTPENATHFKVSTSLAHRDDIISIHGNAVYAFNQHIGNIISEDWSRMLLTCEVVPLDG